MRKYAFIMYVGALINHFYGTVFVLIVVSLSDELNVCNLYI